MSIQKLTRTFKFKEQIFSDPNPKWTENEVREFFANEYPELNNANISSPVQTGSEAQYTFETNVGTKGQLIV